MREVGIGQGPMARGKPCVPTPRVESPDLDRPCCRVCTYVHTYIHTYVVGLHMRYAMHVGMPLGRGRGLADGQGARGCKLPK